MTKYNSVIIFGAGEIPHEKDLYLEVQKGRAGFILALKESRLPTLVSTNVKKELLHYFLLRPVLLRSDVHLPNLRIRAEFLAGRNFEMF